MRKELVHVAEAGKEPFTSFQLDCADNAADLQEFVKRFGEKTVVELFNAALIIASRIPVKAAAKKANFVLSQADAQKIADTWKPSQRQATGKVASKIGVSKAKVGDIMAKIADAIKAGNADAKAAQAKAGQAMMSGDMVKANQILAEFVATLK